MNNHTVSQPIPMQRRQTGSNTGTDSSAAANHDPSTNAGLLSPRSVEAHLGIKFVNLLLEDNSPSVKDFVTPLKSSKSGKGSNGGGVGSAVDQQDNDAASTDSTSSSTKNDSNKNSRAAKHANSGNGSQQQQLADQQQSNTGNQAVVNNFTLIRRFENTGG